MSRRFETLAARPSVAVAALLLVTVTALLGRDWLIEPDRSGASSAVTIAAGDEAVRQLFEGRQSGQIVVVAGVVDGVLADDNDGSRHQRFIARLDSGHTLLVAHNIDLAPRVPLRPGDRVRVRGEYEWNSQGGVIHWTHHDPAGERPGGWIEFEGDQYR